MTRAQIEVLRREVEQMAAAGASRNEFREWARISVRRKTHLPVSYSRHIGALGAGVDQVRFRTRQRVVDVLLARSNQRQRLPVAGA